MAKEWTSDLWTGEALKGLDLEQQKLWQEEMFDQAFPLVEVMQLDKVKTEIDPLRNEPIMVRGPKGRRKPADRARRFKAPIKLRAYIDHSPRQTTLLRFGFDREREVVFTFLDFVLEREGIIISTGDLVKFEGETFEIQSTRRPTESYWLNTEFKFYVVCSANRYRPEGNRNIDYGGK